MVDQVEEDPLRAYFDLEASKEGFHKILKNQMKKEPQGFLVALSEGEVVGFVLAFKDAFGPNYVTKEKIGYVQAVHVKRGYRRRGIASMLVNASLKYLKDNGCSLVVTETGEPNRAALQLFEKLGFKTRGKLVAFMRQL
jgi:ribosomal protein S18 acetylase RimI-like enzyme